MPVPTESLRVGRCYRTAKAEVFMIVSFDGSRVIYLGSGAQRYPARVGSTPDEIVAMRESGGRRDG